MSTRPSADPLWLAGALVAGLVMRVALLIAQPGVLHPDEIYQYVEPAHWRTEGVGVLAWEMARGVRNWVLPAFYGALLEVANALGFSGLAGYRFLQAHNTIVSLLLVPAGWRIGRALHPGDAWLARLLAIAFALFPPLALYGTRTLSESSGLLATTWAGVFWLEATATRGATSLRKAFWAGACLGLAAVARYTLLIFVAPVFLALALDRRWRDLGRAILGWTAVMAALGLLDALTWGRPFHTLIEYVSFNLMERGAEFYGTSPVDFYWQRLFVEGLGAARFLLIVPALAALAATWRPLLAWLIPLLALSATAHKEERFAVSIWPFVLTAAAAGAFWVWRRRDTRIATAAAFAIVLAASAAALGPARIPPMPRSAGMLDAQAYVGRAQDATGVLIADGWYYQDEFAWSSGGYTALNRSIPQLAFTRELLDHHLFNYVVVASDADLPLLQARSDFAESARFANDVRVFRRGPPGPPTEVSGAR